MPRLMVPAAAEPCPAREGTTGAERWSGSGAQQSLEASSGDTTEEEDDDEEEEERWRDRRLRC